LLWAYNWQKNISLHNNTKGAEHHIYIFGTICYHMQKTLKCRYSLHEMKASTIQILEHDKAWWVCSYWQSVNITVRCFWHFILLLQSSLNKTRDSRFSGKVCLRVTVTCSRQNLGIRNATIMRMKENSPWHFTFNSTSGQIKKKRVTVPPISLRSLWTFRSKIVFTVEICLPTIMSVLNVQLYFNTQNPR
jgi:hypothetical protein